MIPEAAVEAAAKAAAKDEDASNWHDESEHYRNGWRNRMQVGLEAAAPHMLAPSLGDGDYLPGWDDRKQLAEIFQQHCTLPPGLGLSDIYDALIAVATWGYEQRRVESE